MHLDLRRGDVGLVHEKKPVVLWEVRRQGVGSGPRGPPRQVSAVVLNTLLQRAASYCNWTAQRYLFDYYPSKL